MKKGIIYLVSLWFMAVPISSAMEALALGALAPLLGKLAQPLVAEAGKAVQTLQEDGLCHAVKIPYVPSGCTAPLGICKTSYGLSFCKKVCQKVLPIGGYEIKLRFGKDSQNNEWTLYSCIRDGVLAQLTEPLGKQNKTSIAVYTQTQFDDLLDLITRKEAAEKIVKTNGAILSEEDIQKAGATKQEIVAEAEKDAAVYKETIEKNRMELKYGYQ